MTEPVKAIHHRSLSSARHREAQGVSEQPARRITIRDIAERAGVSKGAVSYALNGLPGRLRRHARPHPLDRRRARLVPEPRCAGPLGRARRRVWLRARAAGEDARARAVLHGVPRRRRVRARDAVRRTHHPARRGTSTRRSQIYRRWWGEHRVDGVLVVDLRVDDPRIARARTVSACRRSSSAGRSHDARLASRMARRGLDGRGSRPLSRGARPRSRIAHVAGVGDFVHTRSANGGVRPAWRRSSGSSTDVVETRTTRPRAARERRAGSSRAPTPPTAIVYDSDLLAVSGLGVAQKMGFAVPDELSIVGWDDSLISQVVHPPLTAITRDITAYGVTRRDGSWRRSTEHAIEDVETTRGELTPRGSTAGPAVASGSRGRERRVGSPARSRRGRCRLTLNRISDWLSAADATQDRVRERKAGDGCRRRSPLARRRTTGRAQAARGCGRATTDAVVRDELRTLREHGLQRHSLVLLLARLRPRAPAGSTRTSSVASATSSTRTSTPAWERSRPSSSATCPARTGIPPGVTVATCTATRGSVEQQAWFAGEIARTVRRASCGRRVARLERDAAVRRARDEPRDRRVGARRRRRRARDGRTPADLTRRRGLGHRGLRRTTTATRSVTSRRSSTSSARTCTRCRTTRFASCSRRRSSCELASSLGQPVVLEEFGVSSDFASDENAAHYYRQVLYTTLLAGARGWIAWNNCDYDDLRAEDPYRHHVFEMHFGLTDRHGRPKKQLRALADFAREVGQLARGGLGARQGRRGDRRPRALRARAAVHRACLPRRTSVTTCSSRTSPRAKPTCRSSSSASATASPARRQPVPRPVREAPHRPRPRPACERSPVGGATVYLSYFAGSTTNQRGPWLTWLDEIFGVTHRLRYGLVDPIDDDEAVFQFVEDFGDIAAGTRLTFPVAGEHSARSYLPVDSGRRPDRRHRRPRAPRPPSARSSGSAPPCSAPTPSSTWPRGARTRTRRARGVSTPRSRRPPASRGPFASTIPRVLVGLIRTGPAQTALFVNCSADAVAAEPILDGPDHPRSHGWTHHPRPLRRRARASCDPDRRSCRGRRATALQASTPERGDARA